MAEMILGVDGGSIWTWIPCQIQPLRPRRSRGLRGRCAVAQLPAVP